MLKELIKEHLKDGDYEWCDVGSSSEVRVDYPDFAMEVAVLVMTEECPRGILICGSGIGMSIVANRYRGVRAALCTTEKMAELSRRHNDANVLCLGAEMQPPEEALQILDVWLKTEFEGGRHEIRLEKIRRMEEL